MAQISSVAVLPMAYWGGEQLAWYLSSEWSKSCCLIVNPDAFFLVSNSRRLCMYFC